MISRGVGNTYIAGYIFRATQSPESTFLNLFGGSAAPPPRVGHPGQQQPRMLMLGIGEEVVARCALEGRQAELLLAYSITAALRMHTMVARPGLPERQRTIWVRSQR